MNETQWDHLESQFPFGRKAVSNLRLGNSDQLSPAEYSNIRRPSSSLCEDILWELKVKSSDRLLDIGCGIGTHTEFFRSISKCQVVGLDIAGERIVRARSNYVRSGCFFIRKSASWPCFSACFFRAERRCAGECKA